MYLHSEKKIFLSVLENVSRNSGIQADLIEKDYYVTLILKELAAASDKIVFKGGTSLSKAHKAINRFSEDVDISFTEYIGASRRKKLKYQIIAPIAQKLGVVISNLDKTQSDRDINNILAEICKTDFFKDDYDGVTRFFIFDNMKYKDAKATLQKIIDLGVFAIL